MPPPPTCVCVCVPPPPFCVCVQDDGQDQDRALLDILAATNADYEEVVVVDERERKAAAALTIQVGPAVAGRSSSTYHTGRGRQW